MKAYLTLAAASLLLAACAWLPMQNRDTCLDGSADARTGKCEDKGDYHYMKYRDGGEPNEGEGESSEPSPDPAPDPAPDPDSGENGNDNGAGDGENGGHSDNNGQGHGHGHGNGHGKGKD